MTNKIKILIITPFVFLLVVPFLGFSLVNAAPCTPSASNPSCVCTSQGCDDGKSAAAAKSDSKETSGSDIRDHLKSNPIVKELNKIVAFMSAAVGLFVVGAIIVGGIQYTIAGDNAETVTKAKKRITNGVIALAAFLFTWAFLQWLVP